MTETQIRARSAIAVLLLLTGIVGADIPVAAGTYQTMLSAREDQAEGRDAFVVFYDGFDDLLNSPARAPGSFSGINVSSDYVASGLAFQPLPAVPEPGSAVTLLAGLALLASTKVRFRAAR